MRRFDVGHALACRRAAARHLRVAGEVTGQESEASTAEARASCARLDKLKHVPRNKSAETSLGAADTSVRATSKSQVRRRAGKQPAGVRR
jgi:hypothetical protein